MGSCSFLAWRDPQAGYWVIGRRGPGPLPPPPRGGRPPFPLGKNLPRNAKIWGWKIGLAGKNCLPEHGVPRAGTILLWRIFFVNAKICPEILGFGTGCFDLGTWCRGGIAIATIVCFVLLQMLKNCIFLQYYSFAKIVFFANFVCFTFKKFSGDWARKLLFSR